MSKKKTPKVIAYKEYLEPVTLKIEKVDDKGVGIAYLDDYLIYVENTITGDVIEASILPPFANGSKRRGGKILSFIKRSEFVNTKHLEFCNSSIYAYGNFSYEKSLELKASNIKEALAKANINYQKDIEIEPTTNLYPCRYKSIRYFACKDGQIINGFYKANSHQIEKVDICKSEPLWFSKFATSLATKLSEAKCLVYDELNQSGCLRHLLLRQTHQGRLCVLTCACNLTSEQLFLYKAQAKAFEIDCVYFNLNDAPGNQVLNGTLSCLSDKAYIEACFDNLKFKVGPNTFLQVNYEIASKLYDYVIDYCKQTDRNYALDLCCGVGTMSLMLAKHFNFVSGFEIVKSSVEAAIDNAKLNSIENVDFKVCNVQQENFLKLTKDNVSAIICDPSRVGIGTNSALNLTKVKKGEKLAYIFCSLKALSRDLKVLVDGGFEIKEVKGFDMFPFSSHIETVVLLEKV